MRSGLRAKTPLIKILAIYRMNYFRQKKSSLQLLKTNCSKEYRAEIHNQLLTDLRWIANDRQN